MIPLDMYPILISLNNRMIVYFNKLSYRLIYSLSVMNIISWHACDAIGIIYPLSCWINSPTTPTSKPHQDASNENPQCLMLWRNKKNVT